MIPFNSTEEFREEEAKILLDSGQFHVEFILHKCIEMTSKLMQHNE